MKTNKEIKIKKSKIYGITLIALVITIIVLLILAGTSISMLSGNNSILNQAGRTRDLTDQKDIEERVKFAYFGALASEQGKVTSEYFIDELAKYFGYDKIKNENITKNANGTWTIIINGKKITTKWKIIDTPSKLTDEEKTKLASNGLEELKGTKITNKNLKDRSKIKAVITGQVPIPVNAFYEEGTVDSGVVIKFKESEFVWVPVPNAIYDHTNDEKLPKSLSEGSLTENHDYTPMAIQIDGNYKGLLYDYSVSNGAFLKYPSKLNYQGVETGEYREPEFLLNYDDNESYGRLFDASGFQQSYNKMVTSVSKYGGFFIGRYETSLDENNKAQSKPGKIPTNSSNNNTKIWYGLYQKQREFTDSTDKMQSEMIWGSQYDAMLNWAVKGEDKANVTADSNALHNYSSAQNTGAEANDIINNIYDLEGNVYDWTQESLSPHSRTIRGGAYGYKRSPCKRGYDNVNVNLNRKGSRLSLYIK